MDFYSLPQGLTQSTLFDSFCNNGKDVQNFSHYARDRVYRSFICRHFGVCVQTSKKCFYAVEHLKEGILIRANVLSCLRIVHITMNRTKVLRRLHTERSTPNPIKITFAGENTCQIYMRGLYLEQVHVLKHTEPTPSPSVSENARRTFTVGSSHFPLLR